MTRLLIVDDDPAQLQSLARVLAVRREDLSVLTALNGTEAIELLRSTPIDIVLTDLQMPEKNGFDLLAWLVSHRPELPVFTMTAYPDDASLSRLRTLGNLACFTKPLDVGVVLDRLATAVAEGVRGHVRNISLAAFLQLMEMERSTCTLTVVSAGETGKLFIQQGALIDARAGEAHGEQAVMTILGWDAPFITIVGTCAAARQTIRSPVAFLIMEAMRLKDEASRAGTEAAAVGDATAPASETLDLDLGDLLGPGPTSAPASRSVSEYPASLPDEADAVAVIELPSGRVRTWDGFFEHLDAVATLVARLFTAERAAVARLGTDERVEEMVFTTARYWALARPLRGSDTDLVLLVFDPERANVVMERLELEKFMADLDAWSLEDLAIGERP